MGFKIIRDFIKEKDEEGAVGIESKKPRHFLQAYIDRPMDDDSYEYNGGKIKVRLLDGDNQVYYHALVDDDDFSCDLCLNWGGGYAGCVSLDMHIDSYIELFGKPKYEKLISKDGRWYGYMG